MRLKTTRLEWNAGRRSIPYLVGYDCADQFALYIRRLEPDRVLIVADRNVEAQHARVLQSMLRPLVISEITAIEGTEDQKTLASIEAIASQALRHGVTRRTIIVAMGGGMTGNIAGLLAAMLFRGIRLIHMPTTLLAMHDSVTSMKQTVNCYGVKNLLGTFYRPTAILVDLSALNTLPTEHLRSGIFELVKNALVLGDPFLRRLKELSPRVPCSDPSVWLELIRLGVEAKRRLLLCDPYERDSAIVFEYGHTIGHALELACNGALTHGECVAWGMLYAGSISGRLGFMSTPALEEHDSLIRLLGPLNAPAVPPQLEDVINRVLLDNKRGYIGVPSGTIPMILLRGIGEVVGNQISHYLTAVPVCAVRDVVANSGVVSRCALQSGWRSR